MHITQSVHVAAAGVSLLQQQHLPLDTTTTHASSISLQPCAAKNTRSRKEKPRFKNFNTSCKRYICRNMFVFAPRQEPSQEAQPRACSVTYSRRHPGKHTNNTSHPVTQCPERKVRHAHTDTQKLAHHSLNKQKGKNYLKNIKTTKNWQCKSSTQYEQSNLEKNCVDPKHRLNLLIVWSQWQTMFSHGQTCPLWREILTTRWKLFTNMFTCWQTEHQQTLRPYTILLLIIPDAKRKEIHWFCLVCENLSFKLKTCDQPFHTWLIWQSSPVHYLCFLI